VGLVGVARSRGGGREVERLGRGVEHTDEALEAQHALQRLGAVARRRVAAPAQLALAEADLLRDGFGAR
jgi:hypothetical protein